MGTLKFTLLAISQVYNILITVFSTLFNVSQTKKSKSKTLYSFCLITSLYHLITISPFPTLPHSLLPNTLCFAWFGAQLFQFRFHIQVETLMFSNSINIAINYKIPFFRSWIIFYCVYVLTFIYQLLNKWPDFITYIATY